MPNPISQLLKGFFTSTGKDPAIKQNALNLTVGGYEAAAYSNKRSYIFTTQPEVNANPDSFSRREIVRIARYLVKNFPLFERILSCVETYAIGSGIFPNAATSDSEFNALATRIFNQWANSPFCSSNNELTGLEQLKLMVREIVVAGEIFIVQIKSPLTQYPQIQLVATENVRGSGDADDTSVDGLYVDAYGKVTAYNIFSGNKYQVVDASNVVHLKRTKYVGQLRGESYFPSCLNSARDVKDLEGLLKSAVKMQATYAVAVAKKAGEAGDGGSLGNVIPTNTGIPTTGYANSGLERAYGPIVSYMNEGESVELLASEHPTENVMAFIEYLYRSVCMSVGISYEFIVNPDKLTGTGVRFILSDAQAFFAGMQNIVINSGWNRIYSWVIASFIKSGKLPQPKGNDIYSVSWTKPASITIDPTRVSSGEIALLEAGLQTREGYYSARGKDWKAEAQQGLNELEYLISEAKKRNLPIELVLQQYQVGAKTVDPGIEQLVSQDLEQATVTDVVPQNVEDEEEQAAA